jgi:hypothetical protein
MLWIPITIWAAFAQTVRNAAQRHLTAELGFGFSRFTSIPEIRLCGGEERLSHG